MALANITKEKRPSVETSIHNIIGYSFVVHLHPTYVNGITCSTNAQENILNLFGEEHLFIPYTDPGYVLFKEIESRKLGYIKNFGKEPSVIWLQNHGIFVGADTIAAIKNIYSIIIDTIKSKIADIPLIESCGANADSLFLNSILKIFPDKNIFCRTSDLIFKFASDKMWFSKVSKPFIPDQIVYCKASYLYFNKDMLNNEKEFKETYKAFLNQHQYLPKVLLIKDNGLLTIGNSVNECINIADVFEDAIKIAAIAENFGGSSAMTEKQINFIENWEVESYRRKIAGSLNQPT